MPSLREIPEDIPLMIQQVLEKLAAQVQMLVPELTKNALNALMDYDYPGNVRELENILERSLALCDGKVIDTADLYLTEARDTTSSGAANLSGERTLPLHEYLDQIERQQIMKALEATRFNKTAAAKVLGITFRSLRYRLDRLGIE